MLQWAFDLEDSRICKPPTDALGNFQSPQIHRPDPAPLDLVVRPLFDCRKELGAIL